MTIRLGVNIDHVATVRNARGGAHPDPARAARLVEAAGADGLTIHLREDRRHIRDSDLPAIAAATRLPINLEMAATEAMLGVALAFRPHAVCLVPERREERTTEGGLDAEGQRAALAPVVSVLGETGIRVSLFIEPDVRQLKAAAALGAPVVELHTGAYCAEPTAAGLRRLQEAARFGAELGLEIHAGHGLDYRTVQAVAAIPPLAELNIGHFLVGEALFVGLEAAVREMRALMAQARGA